MGDVIYPEGSEGVREGDREKCKTVAICGRERKGNDEGMYRDEKVRKRMLMEEEGEGSKRSEVRKQK